MFRHPSFIWGSFGVMGAWEPLGGRKMSSHRRRSAGGLQRGGQTGSPQPSQGPAFGFSAVRLTPVCFCAYKQEEPKKYVLARADAV